MTLPRAVQCNGESVPISDSTRKRRGRFYLIDIQRLPLRLDREMGALAGLVDQFMQIRPGMIAQCNPIQQVLTERNQLRAKPSSANCMLCPVRRNRNSPRYAAGARRCSCRWTSSFATSVVPMPLRACSSKFRIFKPRASDCISAMELCSHH